MQKKKIENRLISRTCIGTATDNKVVECDTKSILQTLKYLNLNL